MAPSNTTTGPSRFRQNAESFSPSEPANIQMQQAAAQQAAVQQATQQSVQQAAQHQQFQAAQIYQYYNTGPPPINPYYQYVPQPQFMPMPYGYMYPPQYGYAPSYQQYQSSSPPIHHKNTYYKNNGKLKKNREFQSSENVSNISVTPSATPSVEPVEKQKENKEESKSTAEVKTTDEKDIKVDSVQTKEITHETNKTQNVPEVAEINEKIDLPLHDIPNKVRQYPVYINFPPTEFAKIWEQNKAERDSHRQATNEDLLETVNSSNEDVIIINKDIDSCKIINYNDIVPQVSKPKNWASFLHSTTAASVKKEKKNIKVPVSSAPTTNSNTSSSTVFLPPVADSNNSSPLGIVLLKLMYDPSLSTLNQRDLPVYQIKPRGLTNTGNICYMNSVLQVLLYCEPFNRMLKLIEKMAIGSMNSETPLLDLTAQFFNDFLSVTTSKALNPEKFYFNLIKLSKFSHLKWGQQEDAEEFMGYFLDGLQEEFVAAIKKLDISAIDELTRKYNDKNFTLQVRNTIKLIKGTESGIGKESNGSSNEEEGGWSEVGSNKKVSVKRTVEIEPTPVTYLFGGQFRSVLTVPKSKESQSITLDPFQNIQLDISDSRINTIEDAFKTFNEPENILFKSSSNQEVVAKKQTFIDQLPNIMIIHLKRFAFQQHNSHNLDTPSGFTPSKTSNSNTGSSSNGYPNNNMNNNNNNVNLNSNNNDAFAGDKNSFTAQSKQNNFASSVNSDNSSFLESGNGHIPFGEIEKIRKKVQYSHTLSIPSECLARKTTTSKNYRLIGVVYHHGNSAGGGHYTCDVLRRSSIFDKENESLGKKVDNEWIRIDDTQVSIIDKDEVISGEEGSKTAYILMYQKV